MTCDMWHDTHPMGHVTSDTWHVTCDMWYVTCDTWHVTWDMCSRVFHIFLLLFIQHRFHLSGPFYVFPITWETSCGNWMSFWELWVISLVQNRHYLRHLFRLVWVHYEPIFDLKWTFILISKKIIFNLGLHLFGSFYVFSSYPTSVWW